MLRLEKYVKQVRKKLLSEMILKAIQALSDMGVILFSLKETNTQDGFNWIFYLNKNYE